MPARSGSDAALARFGGEYELCPQTPTSFFVTGQRGEVRSQPDNGVAPEIAEAAHANKPKKGGGGLGAEFSPPPIFLFPIPVPTKPLRRPGTSEGLDGLPGIVFTPAEEPAGVGHALSRDSP